MRRIVGMLSLLAAVIAVPTASARVLLVGTYHGIRGGYSSIQAAVDAARTGDFILVAPGDYKEQADHRRNRGPQPDDYPAGVVIAKARITLRGMNRNAVIVDGTKPGSTRCSNRSRAQDLGVADGRAGHLGRNGILVWQANDVTVQNLTICNFLNGPAGDNGNEIWWQGGHENGGIGGHGFLGTYLSTTSTYFGSENDRGAVRDLLQPLERGDVDQRLRLELQRLGLLHRRLQAGVRPGDEPRPGGIQRPRLLGVELRGPDAGRELRVRQQRGRVRHQQPER